MRLVYTLTVDVPDTIDADTRAEILEAAEPYERDDKAACVQRWLGDKLCDIEEELDMRLPDGWNVRIEEATTRTLAQTIGGMLADAEEKKR